MLTQLKGLLHQLGVRNKLHVRRSATGNEGREQVQGLPGADVAALPVADAGSAAMVAMVSEVTVRNACVRASGRE